MKVNASWKGVKYPTDVFEARNSNGVYFPRTGEEGIALRMFHSTKPADSVSTSPSDVGFIAILDLPTAVRFNLPIAGLTNGIGAPVVGPTTDSILAGYEAMTTVDGFHVPPAAPTNPQAWPLAKVDHTLVPEATDATKVKNIQRLLGCAVGRAKRLSLPVSSRSRRRWSLRR